MELICEKYREKAAPDMAFCSHPTEYCKFRHACLLHFLGKEKAEPVPDDNQSGPAGEPVEQLKPV